MARPCRTCTHPERERIELELANARAFVDVARRWEIPPTSIKRHVHKHMTQEQIARLRHGFPDSIEIDIDKLTREGGQGAILGLKRLILEQQEAAYRCDAAGLFEAGIRARQAQATLYKEQAKLAALYPGLKTTTNNNLIVADFNVFADQLDKVLRPFPEARQAVAAMFSPTAALAAP